MIICISTLTHIYHPLAWGFASPATPALATPSQAARGSVTIFTLPQGFRLRPAGYAETGTPWAIELTAPPVGGAQKALHADALYESLRARQQCWRARLTPKPYRVGITRFPRLQDSESIHTGPVQAWLQKYEALCQGKAVCRLVDCLGRPIQSPMVELHDSLTLATKQDLPLA